MYLGCTYTGIMVSWMAHINSSVSGDAVYLGCTHIGIMVSWMAHINSSVSGVYLHWYNGKLDGTY